VTGTATRVELDSLGVAAEPARWRSLGFTVDDDGTCRVGTVRLALTGEGRGKGIHSWALRADGRLEGDLDGLTPAMSERQAAAPAAHDNGTLALDHLVVLTPDLERTVAGLEDGGLENRGTFHYGGQRQSFFRLGEVLLEVVGPEQREGDGPSRLFGLAFTVADIDAAADFLGEHLGQVKDAAQPGRRIATLRSAAGAGCAVALMSPGPPVA
jgi:hypothetical protein